MGVDVSVSVNVNVKVRVMEGGVRSGSLPEARRSSRDVHTLSQSTTWLSAG